MDPKKMGTRGTRSKYAGRSHPGAGPAPSLDQNTISGTTSKRQLGAPSRMITIPGTNDHHHLESVITIIWND
jgi:hypothetical protein